ncbi:MULTISPECIES: 2OG-Fe dioxygenase family protein [Citrobacter]|uniref:2OG-Fe dioxygenase family protein n=1 Tax=Citrobacter TaxID=544 RepID=UPI0006A988C5|nr:MULTISPECIES: 2OG-Fe dioxygenase family protein [Citrobacter]QLY03444.1 2OG-Fe dioxygenase family protein [Citrobacter sp. RHBSTW-00599]TCC80574.1 hypothetical protein EY919_00835 [Citrobacter braakii]WFY29322.1 2OG-Fe dioxygenase family protein [Citrobacter braakii]
MHAYHHIRLGKTSAKVKNSFDELLPDPWLKAEDGIFRFRSYMQARAGREKYFDLCAVGEFFQAGKLNNYAGGIARKYPEIKQDVAEEVMNLVFRKLLPLLPDTTYNIGIHQIRITTDDRRPGYPAPEGIHKDGFKYIAIYCSEIENVTGGETTLIPNHDGGNDASTFKLHAGDAVIFNDVNYQHYTAAVVPLLPGKGYRDVFVITFDIE